MTRKFSLTTRHEGLTTKKAAADRVRGIVAAYGDDQSITGCDFDVLHALLQWHPESEEKTGCGVASFFPRPAMYKKRGLWLRRIDETETDWSWVACLRNPRPIDDLRKAFRVVVQDQIREARDAAFGDRLTAICPLSGRRIGRSQSHVHHAGWWGFARLVSEFCRIQPLDPNTVQYVEGDGVMGTSLHPAFGYVATAFQSFHRCLANLEVVDGSAHMSLKVVP